MPLDRRSSSGCEIVVIYYKLSAFRISDSMLKNLKWLRYMDHEQLDPKTDQILPNQQHTANNVRYEMTL